MSDITRDTSQLGTEEAQKPPGRSVDPVASLSRHRRTFAILFIVGSVVSLVYAYFEGAAVYRSTGVFHVNPRFTRNLSTDQEFEIQSNSQYRQFVQQQVRTVNRYDVLEEALSRLDAEENNWWQKDDESRKKAIFRLQGDLQVRPVPDTYLVTVSLERKLQGDGIAALINHILDVYLEKAKDEEFFEQTSRLGFLEEEEARLRKMIATKAARRAEISQDLATTTFNPYNINPYDSLLITTREALLRATEARIAADDALEAVTAGAHESAAEALTAMAWSKTSGESELNGLKFELGKRRAELVQRQSGITDAHPAAPAIAAEEEDIERTITGDQGSFVRRHRRHELAVRQADAFAARETERELQEKLATQEAKAREYAAKYFEAVQLGTEITEAQNRLNDVVKRLDFLRLESEAPGFVRLTSAALDPIEPFDGGRKKLFGTMLAATLIGCLGFVIGIDYLDPRVHNRQDLHRGLGFPGIGWVPAVSDDLEDLARRQREDIAKRLAPLLAEKPHQTWIVVSDQDVAWVREQCRELAATLKVVAGVDVAVSLLQEERDDRGQGLRLIVGEPVDQSAETRNLVETSDLTLFLYRGSVSTGGNVRNAIQTCQRLDPDAVAGVLFEQDPERLEARDRQLLPATPQQPSRLAWLFEPWKWG